MPICSQRTCGCAITSTDLAISGSGTPLDPWNIGYPVSASLLSERTFLNAATRDAALPSPAEGQEAWLQTEDVLTRFFGGAWRTVYKPVTAYSPIFSAFTVGASTIVARYARDGDLVHYQGGIVWGAGAAFTGGAVQATVPVAASYANRVTGTAGFYDSSAGLTFAGACNILVGGTGMVFYVMVGGAYNPTGANPFAWANGDEFWWSITYPAA